MDGAEFQTPGGELVQVLLQDPDAHLLLDPARKTWLPWGRRQCEEGEWPVGGQVPWSSIYRTGWQCWSPERVLLRPLRWRASNQRWVDLRPGFAILALQLRKVPGTPLYIVTLDGGAPKLMPRVAEWELDQTARRREAEARQNALDEASEAKARLATEIFLLEIECAVGKYSRDEVKAWSKERARQWWREEVSIEFPKYADLFEYFWGMNETRRWVGKYRF